VRISRHRIHAVAERVVDTVGPAGVLVGVEVGVFTAGTVGVFGGGEHTAGWPPSI
jgi:hypothetical protein